MSTNKVEYELDDLVQIIVDSYKKIVDKDTDNDVENLELDIKKYLNCKKGEIVKIEKEESGFWVNSLIEKVNLIIEKNYKIMFIKAYDTIDWDRVAPTYINIETSLMKTKKLFEHATFFCTDMNEKKVVLNMLKKYGDLEITIYYKSGNEKVGDKLFNSIEDVYKTNSMYKNRIINCRGEFVRLRESSWKDIIIDNSIYDDIYDNIIFPIENYQTFTSIGLQPSRGVLLEGPPGVGKTLLSTIIANELKCTCIIVNPSDLTSASQLRMVYRNARLLAPTIVIIEDVDMISTSRHSSGNNELLSELMHQLDGVEKNKGVYSIVNTNRPEVIEEAVINRPGRIDRRINMGIPSRDHRMKIFNVALGEQIILDKDIDINYIIHNTENYSGAQMKELVYMATTEALKSIKKKKKIGKIVINSHHLENAIAKIKKENDQYKNLYI